MNEDNPYQFNDVCHRIWERNKQDSGDKIRKASSLDKYIIYLYVVGRNMREISKISGYSYSTISNKLNKYEVKIK